MEAHLKQCEVKAGPFAILLTADLPSTCQQKLCGELEWDIKLDKRPVTTPTADAEEGDGEAKSDGGGGDQQRKKHKSQRRMEKEQEYFERQKRMHEAQKAKAEAMKRTKCRFFALGKCKEGDSCRFGHD